MTHKFGTDRKVYPPPYTLSDRRSKSTTRKPCRKWGFTPKQSARQTPSTIPCHARSLPLAKAALYVAISACNFRSSSSSSSSSTLAGALPLTSACGATGKRPTLSPTGTAPVLSICSSSCSCWSSASSSSRSSSSMTELLTPERSASEISSPIAC